MCLELQQWMVSTLLRLFGKRVSTAEEHFVEAPVLQEGRLLGFLTSSALSFAVKLLTAVEVVGSSSYVLLNWVKRCTAKKTGLKNAGLLLGCEWAYLLKITCCMVNLFKQSIVHHCLKRIFLCILLQEKLIASKL